MDRFYDDDRFSDKFITHRNDFISYPQDENEDYRSDQIYPNLPEKFDAREAWPHCETIEVVPRIGNCRSGGVVAVASVISDRVSLNSFIFRVL